MRGRIYNRSAKRREGTRKAKVDRVLQRILDRMRAPGPIELLPGDIGLLLLNLPHRLLMNKPELLAQFGNLMKKVGISVAVAALFLAILTLAIQQAQTMPSGDPLTMPSRRSMGEETAMDPSFSTHRANFTKM